MNLLFSMQQINPMIFIIAMIAIFYFFMIRPQRKRQKEIDNFRNGLQAGQEVVTAGGIYGKIKEVSGNIVVLEVAHNVNIRVDKSTIYANTAASQQQ